MRRIKEGDIIKPVHIGEVIEYSRDGHDPVVAVAREFTEGSCANCALFARDGDNDRHCEVYRISPDGRKLSMSVCLLEYNNSLTLGIFKDIESIAEGL